MPLGITEYPDPEVTQEAWHSVSHPLPGSKVGHITRALYVSCLKWKDYGED
jgi:hypothetical protein